MDPLNQCCRIGLCKIVTFDVASRSEQELRKEVTEFRDRNVVLLAIVLLVVVLFKVRDFSLVWCFRRRLFLTGETL